jgi:hypothetical protein
VSRSVTGRHRRRTASARESFERLHRSMISLARIQA